MAANSDMNCVKCQSELSLVQGFKIHKCLACYCETCANIPDCVSCKIHICDVDFIHFDKLEPCHFYNECKSQATMKCSCINKAICGQHLINIHADVPGKKCEPETLHGNHMEMMCAKCNKLFARYVNKNNQQEICLSCFHDADSNDFVPKDLSTYENLKSKLELINNALDKNIELNKTRVVEFENSMEQKKKITDEALNRLSQLTDQCNHENMEKLTQMKSINSEAVVAANKIKNLNMNDILIQAAKNKQIDIKITLDKWQTWMKDRVQKLENPSVSRISIEFREDQGTSVTHKIIVRQEQHLGSCNFESCHPDNNMMVVRNIISGLDNLTARLNTSTPIPESSDASRGTKRPSEVENQAKRHETSMTMSSDDDDESIFGSEDDGPLFMSHHDSYVKIKPSSIRGMVSWFAYEPIHVKLTSIRCPLWFYLEKPEFTKKRMDIIETLNKVPIKKQLKVDVKPGDYAVIEDNPKYGSPMKRARIKSRADEPDSWYVKLLDYGRDIKISREKIYDYPDILDEFTEETCFKAALLGVKPLSNFIFVHIIPRNTVNYIKSKLLPPSEILTVYRRFTSPDGRIFCDIMLKRNEVELDWAKELISANLAQQHDGPFVPSKDYCYLGHYNGKCRESCSHIHLCPYCHGNHFLKHCKSFVKMTKEREGKE